MSNCGSSCAASCAASNAAMVGALAAGTAAREAEEAKERRLSQIGKDQVLIQTKMSVDSVGNTIFKRWDNWCYKDGKIFEKRSKESYYVNLFVIVFALTGLVLFVFWLIVIHTLGWLDYLPLDMVSGLIVSAIVGLMAVLFSKPTEEEINKEIDYIRISNLKNKTTVLIKVYTSDGYRNIDDDEILKISERIEPIKE